ncbi:CHAP domain-containing protein [Actinocrispum sp. NPDC049592]|uniref:CHAP domain-containing protein n=1 Tax=Actinocrispum sp. NPDC049592 TaxID=3154835 RepID=UPI003414A3BD
MDQNVRDMARELAPDLFEHYHKLAGKADDAVAVQFAFHQTAAVLDEQRDAHANEVAEVLSHWKGHGADGFERRSARLGRQLRVTGSASRQAEKIVADVTAALSSAQAATQRLIDEYLTNASRILDAGVKMHRAGAQAAFVNAVATVADKVAPRYVKESAANLKRVRAELTDAAGKLRALEKEVEHDGVADVHVKRLPGGGTRVQHILDAARKELGTKENPPGSNRNPYGPTAPWCSSFATAMWRKAGMNIPLLPFTGAVYRWGQQHGKAYGRNQLNQAKPGDVLLFGTGPESPSTSKHIGIVEKVHGNHVTLIEGNSGDQVRRNTHVLSPSTFYGGVHP